jgi:hypothetical protein
MRSPEELLAVAQGVFEAEGLAFALIGGCARNTYAPPRATRGADFAVALDAEQLARLLGRFADHGFQPATSVTAEPSDDVPDLILFQGDDGGRIGVLIAKTDFEREALRRAAPRTGSGTLRVPIVSVEDLLVYKLLAGRPRDLADAEEVSRSQERAGHVIDWDYVQKHCDDWGTAYRLLALRERLDRA